MQASPLPYPSEVASNVLLRPLLDNAPRRARLLVVLLTNIMLVPALTAREGTKLRYETSV